MRERKTTQCSVFLSPDAPSRLVKLHSARLSVLPSLSFSLSRSLAQSSVSIPDLGSYLYDICVHYLARGVHGTGISSWDELRRGEKTEEESARVPSLSASEKLIQPPETSSATISGVQGRIIPLALLSFFFSLPILCFFSLALRALPFRRALRWKIIVGTFSVNPRCDTSPLWRYAGN